MPRKIYCLEQLPDAEEIELNNEIDEENALFVYAKDFLKCQYCSGMASRRTGLCMYHYQFWLERDVIYLKKLMDNYIASEVLFFYKPSSL